MKVVYICAPLGGDVEGNIEQVKRYARYALEQGVAPLVPHYYALSLNDNNSKEREKGMQAATSLLYFCDEMWVFGNYDTTGMRTEIQCCRSMGKHYKRIKNKDYTKKDERDWS